jgi:hypothetical protein
MHRVVTGTGSHKGLDPDTRGVMQHEGAHGQVLIEEFSGPGLVGRDPACETSQVENGVRLSVPQ